MIHQASHFIPFKLERCKTTSTSMGWKRGCFGYLSLKRKRDEAEEAHDGHDVTNAGDDAQRQMATFLPLGDRNNFKKSSVLVNAASTNPIYTRIVVFYHGALSTVLVHGWQQHVANKGCRHPEYHKLPMFEQHMEDLL